MPWWGEQDDVVISGLSGRFPESDNMSEFAEHLLNGDDLITEDDRRWEPGLSDLPKRHAKLKDLSKFDASFFGVPPKQAHYMDPQIRLLLEVAYEAILDAGIDPQSLRGSKTGVFIGASGSETGAAMTIDPENLSGYSLTGCVRSMFANRLSFALDLQGPSFAVDTACSSSLLALQLALDAIRTGQCDAALVGGAHLTLSPTTSIQFLRLNMLAADGACKSFDASGDGYARSEGVSCILLQRASVAKRIYATVVHGKSNTDGYKEHGITFPSGSRQTELLKSVYREAEIDPSSVVYVECHGTGTKVGDPQEAEAIAEVFCKDRKQPLLVGSVKSNMGHCEPASGMASVAKLIIAMERGFIPPNLHFKKPNPNIPSLLDGRLKVVAEKTQWEGGHAAVNSFGFGGSNTHILLRSLPRKTEKFPSKNSGIPRLICVPGRTSESTETQMRAIVEHGDDEAFLNLVAQHANSSPYHFPFRGYTMLRKDTDDAVTSVQKTSSSDVRSVFFVFSGMGSQWAGMARDLMVIDCFRDSVLKSSQVLKPLGVNPYEVLMKGDDDDLKDTMKAMVSITTVQLALIDLLRKVGVEPDGIIGHSTGEVACAFADESMDREQTMHCIYHRGKSVADAELPPGAMAAIGLTWEEAGEKIPEGVVRACHNGSDSITVSGEAEKVEDFVAQLEQEGIFAKMVNCGGVAFHSPMMKAVEEDMLSRLREVLPEPKRRTSRWISSSVDEEDWDGELAQTCSAEYQVHNAMSPVLFYEALQKIPSTATVIEIAPHGLMQAILRRTLPSSATNVCLMKAKHENNLEFLFQALGKIYQSGVSIKIQNLYPPVEYPVPAGTPMISPLMKWDHSQSYHVISSKDIHAGGGYPASRSYTIDPFASDSKEKYMLDHVIDGRPLFPFTGHVVFAWKAMCQLHKKEFQKTPVIVEDVSVLRPTLLTKPVKLDVVVNPEGDFQIMEGDSMAAKGRIKFVEDTDTELCLAHIRDSTPSSSSEQMILKPQDIYKELRLRGYEYGPNFSGIYQVSNSGENCRLCWNGNWITFLDSLLQATVLMERADTLKLPVRLRYLRIDPQQHLDAVHEEGGTQWIEMKSDRNVSGCIAGGVELFGLTASTVARRLHTSSQVRIGKQLFFKFLDNECFKEVPRVQSELQKYAKYCRGILAAGLVKWRNSAHIRAPLSRYLKELSINLGDGAEYEATQYTYAEHLYRTKCVNDSNCGLYQLLRDIFPTGTNGTQGVKLEERIKNLVREHCELLQQDKYWGASRSHRMIKPVIDIVIINTPGHYLRGVMAEPQSLVLTKLLRDCVHTHPLMVNDWTLAGPSLDALDKETVDNSGFATLNMDFENLADPPEAIKNVPLVCLERVLSRKSDIAGYLTNMKKFLRDDGFVIVEEVTQDYELAAFFEVLTSEPPTLQNSKRICGFYLSHPEWMDLFSSEGFNVVSYKRDPSTLCTWYVLRKIPEIPREPTFVSVDDLKEFNWILPLQDAIEERLKEPEHKTIWLVDTETRCNGTIGLVYCLREESAISNRFRTIEDGSLRDGTQRIRLGDASVQRMIDSDLHVNFFQDGEWGFHAMIPASDDEIHKTAETEHAFVNTLTRGDLSSLRWVESPNQFFREDPHLNPSKKLCAVYFAALNFRDIMLATGRLPPDAIPGQFADRECLLGMEYVGRLVKTGQRVMGILPAQALATTLVCDTNYCWPVPEKWTMQEAATVPIVYCTAYYALIVRGGMRKGDKVLIHSGSGGVGQAAIALALHHGCEVFTTVSSEEKKEFLQERFPQLKNRNFSNSRTTEFELHILRETKGKGVQLVLNSLSEDKLQASLRCLSQQGRFLEIGKFDLANNSQLGMAFFLKNVAFHGILLDNLMDQLATEEWREVANLLKEGIESGAVSPIQSTVFEKDYIEEAFRYLAQGKHIGKVLIEVREEDQGPTTIPPPVTVEAVMRSLCHPQHVYLITGGLGGFGLELAQWLINRGARKLVLTTRHGIRTGYQWRSVDHWRKSGITVLISTADISAESNAEALIRDCLELGPLGGVFHLAMILRDCLFENQFAQNFKETAAAKYHGTLNLDKATRKLCGPELRWFVGFSSVVASRGNAGQTNYGWANSAMERIIDKRHADGKGGLAIQWGAIGDVGVIMDNMGTNSTVVSGTLPQRIPSCLQALDAFLNWDYPIVTSYIRAETGAAKKGDNRDIIHSIANILGVSDATELNPNATLSELGLDSLMGVEIKQAVERDYEIVLSMKEIRTLKLFELKALCEGSAELPQGSGGRADEDKDEIEKQMFELFKLRIDVNDIVTYETCAPINNVTEGPAVFFVHSIEGIGSPLKTLAAQINFPAYCFQTTPTTPIESIEILAAFFNKILKEKQPRGPYRLIGYSYGATVAFEMAAQLQAEHPEDPNIVESLVLLDGSHAYMRAYRVVYRVGFGVKSDNLAGDPIFETELLCGFALRFTMLDYVAMRKELLRLPNWEARRDRIVGEIMETGLFDNGATIQWGTESIRAKFLAADKYSPTKKFKGSMNLIRAEESATRNTDVGNDYGLKEVSDGEVKVFIVPGNHDSFIQGDCSSIAAEFIRKILDENLAQTSLIEKGSAHDSNRKFA